MKMFFLRIKRRISTTYKAFVADCRFSFKYAILRIVDELGGRIGFKKLSKKAHDAKDEWIISYLKVILSPAIDKYKGSNNQGANQGNAPIWICWWTGEETAPELVKQCIKSIRLHSNGHAVHLIDSNNYTDFIDIPDYILNKVNSGNIGFAHLADYIRIALICKYGGLWLDATIYCSDDLNETYFDIPFFTSKSTPQECGYLSKLRWTTFVIGGWKQNLFFEFVKSAFELYWSKECYAIDYLFFDHIIETAYREVPAIKDLIDNVPVNNIHRDDLQDAMNRGLPASQFKNVIKSDTIIYKLSWREKYFLSSSEGEESIYSYFMKN